MNKIRLLVTLVCILSTFSTIAQQSIFVELIDGSIEQTALSEVQKITFLENHMILHKTDATTISWSIVDIQKYYYDDTTVGLNTVYNDQTDILIYPNPSNGDININYQLKEQGSIDIIILDINGQVIEKVISDHKTKGNYTLNFNSQLKPGTYFVKIQNESNITTKKILILK